MLANKFMSEIWYKSLIFLEVGDNDKHISTSLSVVASPLIVELFLINKIGQRYIAIPKKVDFDI